MIYKKISVSGDLERKILCLYNDGRTIDEIVKLCNVNKVVVLEILDSLNPTLTRDEKTSFKTYGNSILVISDTHIGNQNENPHYIDEAYNLGCKIGVCSCIHLGDIIQGRLNHTDMTLEYQMDFLDKRYPEPNEYDTEILLGNHDYTVFEYYPYYKQILENKKGFNILGYKRVYFNWNDYLFGMTHKVHQIDDDIYMEDCGLYYIGHGHELKIKTDNKLKAPTLSDDIINKYNGAYPGFMVAYMYGDELSIDVYNFENNKAHLKKENYFNKKLIKEYKVK